MHNPCVKPNRVKISQYLLKDILDQDQARVDYIESKLLKDDKVDLLKSLKATKLTAKSGQSIGTGNYLVQVGFGTPKKDMSIVFDTGSDLTWIQCQPCAGACYSQVDPIFDPSKSTSYSNVSCNTPECNQLKTATGFTPICSSSTPACIYRSQYGDNSSSEGYFARETITIGHDVFPKVLVGCGQYQGGFIGAAGQIGLGRNNISLVSQMSSKYGNIFSYCLPSTISAIGYLALGQTAINLSLQFTPLLSEYQDSGDYVIRMTDFSVGGTKLGIPNSVLAARGTIIDSGTVITRLPPSVYALFRTAFREGMTKYKLIDPILMLDTCYESLTGYITFPIPVVAIHYSPGIIVPLDLRGTIYVYGATQFCLAFAGNVNDRYPTIRGNTQQKKMEVVYDFDKGRIGFSPGNCG